MPVELLDPRNWHMPIAWSLLHVEDLGHCPGRFGRPSALPPPTPLYEQACDAASGRGLHKRADPPLALASLGGWMLGGRSMNELVVDTLTLVPGP